MQPTSRNRPLTLTGITELKICHRSEQASVSGYDLIRSKLQCLAQHADHEVMSWKRSRVASYSATGVT